MSNNTCSFEFDPQEWSRENANCELDEDILEDGVWLCPHRKYDDSEYCIFHQPWDKEIPDRSEKCLSYVKQYSSDDNINLRFIGARFNKLSLDHSLIQTESELEIDLRYSTVRTELNVDHSNISVQLRLNGSSIYEFSAHGSTFNERVNLRNSQIKHLHLQSTEFCDRVELTGISVGESDLYNAEFRDRAILENANFSKNIYAERVKFHSAVSFTDADMEKGGNFDKSVFESEVLFNNVTVGSELSFVRATLLGEVEFAFQSQNSDKTNIDMSKCEVNSGEFDILGENISINFSEALIGNVQLLNQGDHGLNKCIFHKTEFDGFEFSKYTDELISRNWILHLSNLNNRSILNYIPVLKGLVLWRDLRNSGRLDELNPAHPADLRETYLLAKNGAEKVGDNTAAAEFFIHEMRYKRITYYQQIIPDRSLISFYRWVTNWGYSLTSGYGERPGRTILSSLFIVFLFAPTYYLISKMSMSESVAFSFQSFVSLILGPPPEAKIVDQIAAFEAFVGAFMIALFVFTLTRSIRR